ncbi:Ser/Thr protein phosphatase family protein [Penicillium brasilianum]|uniref:Ser/Thr protein phosphatase family protein n=1 Tax=Penicillium brasilianum TaxID=104259 RepID=A0A1S9RJ85_PENBI|nr:Ser/Thr protein phosphatase family protein [Penicillium brasilianum]
MTSKKPPKKVYPITTFISDLPTSLIPQAYPSSVENGSQSRRLVIVGDVHGMRKSLENLLDKVGFNKANGDHVILAGDITNKGPDSSGVVDLAIKLGASAVRGNHDNAVLDAAAEIAANGGLEHFKSLIDTLATPDTPREDLPRDDVSTEGSEKSGPATTDITLRHGAKTYRTALQLSPHQIEWLAKLPLILRIQLPQDVSSSLGSNLVVAHAGLVPGVPLEEQDPHAVLHMRSLTRKSDKEDEFMPDESAGEEGWASEWDRWQDKLTSRTTVVFGHDAKRRLQLGRCTIGLDTACVYGNQLSALVILFNDAKIEHQIISVDCADIPVAAAAPVKEENKTAIDK